MMAILIISGGIVYALFDSLENNAPKVKTERTNGPFVLEFDNDCCDDVYVEPYNQSQLGIKEIIWLDNSTVSITAFVSINCAAWIEGAGFRIHNNTIYLVYYVGIGPYSAICNCAQGLNFTLKNLDHSDYNFELERTTTEYSEF